MAGFNYTVNVYPFNSTGATQAFASVIIDNVLEVKGFKVINGRKGLFVSAPQTKGKDKQSGEDRWYPDVVFKEERDPDSGVYKGPVEQEIFDAILAKYESVSNGGGGNARGQAASAQRNPRQPTNQRPNSPFDEGPAW